MTNCEISVPFRVTVRGGLRFDMQMTAVRLAKLFYQQLVPIKLRVGDGLFEIFARNAGRCYCHAELGEQKNILHKLQQEYPRKDPDSPMRLWGVVQDRIDLIRAMGDTNGFVFFPPDDGQFAEFAYILAEIGRCADTVPVALIGWSWVRFKLLKSQLPSGSSLALRRFSAEQTDEVLDFLRCSEVFIVRTDRRAVVA